MATPHPYGIAPWRNIMMFFCFVLLFPFSCCFLPISSNTAASIKQFVIMSEAREAHAGAASGIKRKTKAMSAPSIFNTCHRDYRGGDVGKQTKEHSPCLDRGSHPTMKTPLHWDCSHASEARFILLFHSFVSLGSTTTYMLFDILRNMLKVISDESLIATMLNL